MTKLLALSALALSLLATSAQAYTTQAKSIHAANIAGYEVVCKKPVTANIKAIGDEFRAQVSEDAIQEAFRDRNRAIASMGPATWCATVETIFNMLTN